MGGNYQTDFITPNRRIYDAYTGLPLQNERNISIYNATGQFVAHLNNNPVSMENFKTQIRRFYIHRYVWSE